MKVELGISSFGETTPLEKTGKTISHQQRIQDLIDEIILADKTGVDIFALGEHHRPDFAVSAPEIVLTAVAAKTHQIHLSTATTNLPTIDPIRVYEQFATMEAIAPDRVEIMAGRGSFTEAFNLFGYDINDYDSLFIEKLELLQKINENDIVDWPGTKHTVKLDHQGIYPHAKHPLPISVATGGTIDSIIRIGEMGLPIVYAIISGKLLHFEPLIRLYKIAATKAGHDISKLPIAAHSWGWLEDDQKQAEKDYFYPTKLLVDQISTEREHWNGMTYTQYQEMIGEDGVIFVGDADTVANKIIRFMEGLGLTRFYLHLPIASMPHDQIMRAIEIYGTQVIPKVKAYFAEKEKAALKKNKFSFQWKKKL